MFYVQYILSVSFVIFEIIKKKRYVYIQNSQMM
jgi:hypothetical protein